MEASGKNTLYRFGVTLNQLVFLKHAVDDRYDYLNAVRKQGGLHAEEFEAARKVKARVDEKYNSAIRSGKVW